MADWTLEGVRDAVEALLADPGVDIVLTYGPVSSSHAINRGGLPKPVVAAFVLDPEAQGFPLETTAAGERVSGVPNLAYITFTGDRTDEIRRLREVAPFRRLTYLTNEALLAAVPVLETNLRRLRSRPAPRRRSSASAPPSTPPSRRCRRRPRRCT